MKKINTTEPKKPESKDVLSYRPPVIKSGLFPIVGIGASAGGLEALEQFFSNISVTTGMAFIVIQHLDPNHKGILGELIQRVTKMKVTTVTDRLKIKPNNIYIIPANKSMSILNGILHLFEPIESHGLRLPIDFFFRSLADELENLGVGIILSGMGSDGSMGLKAIKEKNGLVLVQDPASAKFDSMPRSAIEAVTADVIAPAGELPAKLMAVSGHRPHISANAETKDVSALEKITILLRVHTGQDFSHYKKNTIYRRIERRMSVHQIKRINSYIRYLQENPAEAEILYNELLIGVTSFFRDAEVWQKLKDNIFPSLMDSLHDRHVIRVWIAGCSTGEEAYSMAMVFKEALENQKKPKNLKLLIFATDLDTHAIEKARKGIYTENIISDVPSDRLKRFFVHKDGQFRIIPELREMVVFATQNVIKDPPFTKLDMLMCRNLLIYIDSVLQKKLLSLFHYSLNHNGLLILGNAESVGSFNDYFHVIDSKLKIYKRSDSPISENVSDFPASLAMSKVDSEIIDLPPRIPDNVQTITDQLLLQEFSPPSVLVSDKGDIVYITGHTGKYLAPAAGKANMNLFAMAHEELRNELSIGFRKALQGFEKVILHKIRIGTNGRSQLVDIILQKIENPPLLKGKILVVFSDVTEPVHKPTRKKALKVQAIIGKDDLENEIQRIKDELQITREEMQTSQEELKSTNEELQSTNEELQSTNEELTTSKEEMQSLNEELHTVNIELQGKIEDSARINSDMNNLLNSIEIAALFLDRDFRIRQFTPAVTKIFKIIPSDVGRAYTDQVSDLIYPEMNDDAKEVMRTLVFKEKAIITKDGRWFNIRIMPYRTFEDKIDGLVITLIDITQSKSQEKTLHETGILLRSLLREVPGIILGLSSDGNIIEFNREAESVFGRKRTEVIGHNYFDLFFPHLSRRKAESEIKKMMQGILPQSEHLVKANDGEEIDIEWTVQKLMDENKHQIGIIAIGKKNEP